MQIYIRKSRDWERTERIVPQQNKLLAHDATPEAGVIALAAAHSASRANRRVVDRLGVIVDCQACQIESMRFILSRNFKFRIELWVYV